MSVQAGTHLNTFILYIYKSLITHDRTLLQASSQIIKCFTLRIEAKKLNSIILWHLDLSTFVYDFFLFIHDYFFININMIKCIGSNTNVQLLYSSHLIHNDGRGSAHKQHLAHLHMFSFYVEPLI